MAYPARYESDVVLRDGSTLRLRPVRIEDRDGLLALYERLSPESRRFRFFATTAANDTEVERLLRADRDRDVVLVAEAAGRISGVALYLRDPKSPDRAEVAFAIADPLQGRGVGTRMLEVLAGIARDHRIATFDAYVLQDNRQMLQVFLDSGFETERRLEGGVFNVALSLASTTLSEAKAAERSQSAATASLKAFFEPRSVAVIGANRERGKIGSEMHNVTEAASRASCPWSNPPPGPSTVSRLPRQSGRSRRRSTWRSSACRAPRSARLWTTASRKASRR